jgi:Major Facilitator Superfamily
VTPDSGAQPGEFSPADGPGPRRLLAYRSAQGRWVVAAMIWGSSVAGIDSTVVAVALPAIGRSLHAGFGALQWTVTGYTLTLASLILLAGSLSDRWGRRRVFLAGLASGVNNAVARVAGLLWIAALPPLTGLTGAAYTDPARFQSSFTQISWICAAAFIGAAVLAATFITGPARPAPAPRPALIQTPAPHLACPVAFGHARTTDASSAGRPE